MIIERKMALKIWESAFGKKVDATDFSGRKMNKSAYGQKNSKLGWTLCTLLPRCAGGREEDENLICVHTETAQEKGEGFPFFIASDKKFEITCDDENEWIIVLANDSISIAEQQAKKDAAVDMWNEIFGDVDEATDFCGRKMFKSEYMTDNSYAWKVAPFVEGRAAEGKNAYIASLLTVDEALGRTAFKANGKNYTLNKDSGNYYFKEIVIKPQPKAFDIRNPYDFCAELEKIAIENSDLDIEMLDFIVVKVLTSTQTESATLCALNKILYGFVGVELQREVEEKTEGSEAKQIIVTYRCVIKTLEELEKIFLSAQLLNTYAPLVCEKFDIDELKIYNHAVRTNKVHKDLSVDRLSELYPEFKAFIHSIRNSISFYEGEPKKTFFVSNFVVYNLPALLELHPQDNTKYYTGIYMVEHNLYDKEVQAALQKMLAGEPRNESNEAPVSENIGPNNENVDSVDDEEDEDGDGELTIDFEEFN